MDVTPQCQKILDYIQRNGSMTGMECTERLKILNYKGRVHDLRQLGWPIITQMVYGQRENGDRYRYGRYFLDRKGSAPVTPVKPRRRSGRKLGTWLNIDGCMTCCSQCHMVGCGTPYCPQCGAKMEES